MPTPRTSMRLIKEVLRLKYDAKLSQRRIARSLNIGLGTVSLHLNRAKVANLEWPLPAGLDDAELERRLFPNQLPSVRSGLTEPDYAGMHKELKHKGVTSNYSGRSTNKSRVIMGINTHSTVSAIVTGY